MKTIRILFGLGLAAIAAPAAGGSNAAAHSGHGATFDASGRLWRAAVEGAHLVVSHSDDEGRTFAEAVTVNPVAEKILADGDNRPKIVAAGNGDLYVSWTQGLGKPYAGHIRFSRSLDGGRSFSPPITVNDDLQPISHRFDALVVDAPGRIHLAWLDRRDEARIGAAGGEYAGLSLYYAMSADRGAGFTPDVRLVEHTCECCRVGFAVDRDGVPVLFWRHVYDGNFRDHAMLRLDGRSEPLRVSNDGWAIDACPHHGGALSIGEDNVYHFVWFSGGPRPGLHYARSTDAGRSVSPAEDFGDFSRRAGHPYVLAAGERVARTWKEDDGEPTVVWGQQSRDSGASWSRPRKLASAAAASDHPLLIRRGEDLFLTWNTADRGFIVRAIEP